MPSTRAGGVVNGHSIHNGRAAAGAWQPVGDKDVHSASLRAWWQTTQFCQNKIATAWLEPQNCRRQFCAHEIATGNFMAWF
jgi:hypothetical protein